jgi:hypothetical protein
MPTPVSQDALERAFKVIEKAALAGEPCPQNGSLHINSTHTVALAKQSRIKIEISGRNYRQVTLLTGPNKGRATAPNPNGHMIWKRIDHLGTHILTHDPLTKVA